MAKKVTQRGKRLPVRANDVQRVDAERETMVITAAEAKTLRAQIHRLSAGMNMGCIELGKLLEIVSRGEVKGKGRIYQEWGYTAFKDYCEKELGISRSKGYDLVNLFKQSEAGVFTPKEVESTGWAKVAKLLPLINDGIMTKQNATKWLKKIEDKNFEEVRQIAHLAQIKAAERRKDREDAEAASSASGKAGVDAGSGASAKSKVSKTTTTVSEQVSPEEIYNLKVPLFKDQWENAQIALKKAETVTGSKKLPWLMDCIFMAFNAEGFSKKEQALDEMCRRIERVFSVDIIAMHSKSKQVVFGDRLVKMLMASEGKKEKK